MKEIEEVQEQLKPLLGQSIKNIYHYDMTESKRWLSGLSKHIKHISHHGVLFETNLNQFFDIYESENVIDYGGLFEFIGVYHQIQLSYKNERKLQINDVFWKQFIDRKITDYKIIESENNMGRTDEIFMLPQGIEIIFEDGQSLILIDLTIENHDDKTNEIEFSLGGELVACLDIEDIIRNSNLLEMSCFPSLQK